MKKIIGVSIGVLVLIIIIVFVLFMVPRGEKKEEKSGVGVSPEKLQYKIGESLKVRIENNSEEKLCFSSCYPYYFERKNGKWQAYEYSDCPEQNLVKSCIGAEAIKAFEIILPEIKQGIHRLAVPVCVECQNEKVFNEEKWLYSNEFDIK